MVSAPLNTARLMDWLEERLDAGEAAEVAAAVAAGPQLAETVDWLTRFRAQARAVPLEAPPPVLQQRLRADFAKWAQVRAVLKAEVDSFEAVLLFDSRQDLALAGARGSDTVDDVQLAFTTDVADLLLDVRDASRPGTVSIDGQVLLLEPSAQGAFEAMVTGPGVVRRTVDGDELGRFSLTDVPDTADRIRVDNGHFVIVAPLSLGLEHL